MKNEIKSYLQIDNKFLCTLLYFKDKNNRGCLKISFKNKIVGFVKSTDTLTTLPVQEKRNDETNLEISYKFQDRLLEIKKIIRGKIDREFYQILPLSNYLFLIKIKNWQLLDDAKTSTHPLILNPPSQSSTGVVIIFSFLGDNGLPFVPPSYHFPEGMGMINLPENNFKNFCIGIAEDNNEETESFTIKIPFSVLQSKVGD